MTTNTRTSQGTSPSTPRLWRNRDYLAWLAGDSVSLLGSGVRAFAWPLLVLDQTGSPAFAGVVGTATLLAQVIALVPGGAMTDRCDRRRLLYIAAGSGILLYGVMIAAWCAGLLTAPLMVVLATLTGLRAGLFSTVSDSCLRSIVDSNQLGSAVAANQSRDAALELACAPLGGLLYSAGRIVPFAADAVSYIALGMSARCIRADLSPASHPAQPGGSDRWRRTVEHALGGLRFVLCDPVLRRMVMMVAAVQVTIRGTFVLVVMGLQHQGMAPVLIGAVQSVSGAALLAGAAIATLAIRHLRGGTLVTIGQLGIMAAMLPLLASDSWETVAAGIGVMSVSMPIASCALNTVIMIRTPLELQGRMWAAISVMTLAFEAMAPLLAGWCLSELGWRPTVGVFLGTAALSFAVFLSSPALRTLPRADQLQDALPAER